MQVKVNNINLNLILERLKWNCGHEVIQNHVQFNI